jgi:hypothetical protein
MYIIKHIFYISDELSYSIPEERIVIVETPKETLGLIHEILLKASHFIIRMNTFCLPDTSRNGSSSWQFQIPVHFQAITYKVEYPSLMNMFCGKAPPLYVLNYVQTKILPDTTRNARVKSIAIVSTYSWVTVFKVNPILSQII